MRGMGPKTAFNRTEATMKKSTLILAMAALSGIAGAAHAGNITSMLFKASQSPPITPSTPNLIATVGETVTVTIQGSGQCSGLVFDKGDGSLPVVLQGSFPLTATYGIAGAGIKTLKATPVDGTPDCTGSAGAQVFVAAKNAFTPDTMTWGWGNDHTGKPGENLAGKIGGTGHCDMVSMDFGDGTPVFNTGKIGFFPSMSDNWYLPSHAYAHTGTYHMKISDSGATNCGTMTADAHVIAPPIPPLNIPTPVLTLPAGRPKIGGPGAPVIKAPIVAPVSKP